MSVSRHPLLSFIVHRLSCLVLLAAACWPINTRACPFCVAVKPSFVEQRETADAAFLGECVAAPDKEHDGQYAFAIKKTFAGDLPPTGNTVEGISLPNPIRSGTLALLLGKRDADHPGTVQWHATALNELEFAYVGAAPDLRTPAAKRLAYFARFLEHADPLLAADAYTEFGHAPFDVVVPAAAALNAAKLRTWIVDPAVPAERKGFYGLALGITARGDQRAANLALLDKLLTAEVQPGGDFRSGFDGLVGGYLVATGRQGIDFVAKQFLANPKAAIGDVRQAHKALRFYYEFGPPEQRQAIAVALESLLGRPSDAAAAIVDLARWQQWSALNRIVALYDRKDFDAPDIRRAIVGYLRACPLPAADKSLDALRRRDPKSISAAEAELETLHPFSRRD